ncbi:HugZ family pyridoxamine 5'-phosphate oxidase [Chryseobacterium sp. T1]
MSEHTNPTQLDQSKIKPKAPKVSELIENSKSLILATIDAEGKPQSSYAPFVQIENNFLIFVSFMAKHTKNLKERKSASVMLIDDESTVKQIYARDRLTLDCHAVEVAKEDPLHDQAIIELKNRHGKVVDLLAEMNDFIMINLIPEKGSYVNGFGSAYSVNADLSINEHVKGAHGNHTK